MELQAQEITTSLSSFANDETRIIKTQIIDTINTTKTSKDDILYTLKYLANQIKGKVKEFIERQKIADIYSMGLERSCSMEEASNYIDFYERIKQSMDYPIRDSIEKTKKFNLCHFDKLILITFHKLIFYLHYY
jgi:hypothetical protein